MKTFFDMQAIGDLWFAIAAMYMLPALVAAYRRCEKLSPVIVVDVFLAWTVIGWIVALAMAVSGPGLNRDHQSGYRNF